MKKSKEAPVIVETSVGKFLLREFRPPIQLRTSPRKEKTKLKKEIKRLDENSSSSLKSIKKRIKKRQIKIKKQLSFNNNDEDSDKNSILFIISNNEQENTLNDEELTNTKCSLCFVNSKTRRALIFSPRSSRLTLLGLFSLMQISGPPACLHGFNLEPLKSYFVFNLSSQSLMSIEIASSSSKTSMHENQILSFFNDYRIELPLPEIYIEFIQRLAKFHHGLSVFFVEQFETTWIESMKQFSNSNLSNQWLFHNDDDNDEEQIENTDGFKQLWPGMGAFKHSYHRSIVYPIEIRSTTDEIISRLFNKVTDDPLTVFVCGAKDSGKSTYLRYLINKCLSQTNMIPRIAFLDCDLGQSEFTPSGSISLINNLTEPLFGPSASHLKKPLKSFYFGNIKVENDKILNYLNYVKLSYDCIKNQQYDLLLVNTMGWGSDTGLVIMKELIDLIKPAILVQLRSSSPHFRHIMPDISPLWSKNASISNLYRHVYEIPLNYSYDKYDYNLLLTPVRQHSHGKSNLTRQACLWSYFSQIETKKLIIKPLIDCINHIEILKFEKIGVGLLHRQIESKYLLQVLNGSIIALCRVKHDMLYFASNAFPALIDERANVECLGFGFIRSIDMTRHEIHVIIPDRSISKTMINALVKGYDDCPDEFYFMSIDRWRGHMPPYVTGIFNSIN
ncbi:unnamed protein product [Rotaria socialis]|uniref:Clp1 P-loop domain-containing protein n=2 Tax=Rotaria socialis TaxID=392032 RepID=A0A818EBX3_9BILA|nr:unnamed protein product [Rotaria socialis]CAF3453452.1 unnamed protein product [Rotaria socialis]CAF3456896.1 unnamed protein product [Rotaria socialis]CAF3469933.1 unnamed protein product [Rotaria socialis]CAF4100268.1 unnamed protein product [Rotaria socialis]